MASLGELVVSFSADVSALKRGAEDAKLQMNSVGDSAKSAGGALKSALAAGAVVAGTAAIAAGVAAVKMAGDFQAGMTSLVTGAGESAKNLKMVSDGILQMSVDTGTSTKDLTDGMYMIESAGFHGASGLAVLKAAAEGAKVGNASLADVANGVTTAMIDYSKTGLTAAQATNTLIATVAAGKTHMQDLANAMSTILPTSAAVGVSFRDTSAALATMTGEGTDAASAATYLRQLLMALEAPAKAGAKALAQIGLTTQQVSSEMKVSLPATLQLITDHLKKKFPEGSAAYIEALKNIAGGSKQMQGILELTGEHLKVLKDNLTNITNAVNQGGRSITGWTEVQKDFNFKLDVAKASVEALAIKFGTALLPIVGRVFDWISKTALPGLQKFGDWFITTAVPNIQSLADAISKNILPPIQSLIKNVSTMVTNFVDWLAKSGLLKDAISAVSTVLVTLVGWMSDLIGWFAQGGPQVQILIGAVSLLAGAFLALKIADLTSKFMLFFQKAKEGDGIFSNLADTIKKKVSGSVDGFLSNQAPSLKKAIDSTKKSADDAETSMESIGTKAKSTAATVETETAAMKTDIAAVGIEAEVASGEEGIGKIGPAAEAAEEEVSVQSGIMKAAFAGVATGGIGLIIAGLLNIPQMVTDMSNSIRSALQPAIDKFHQLQQAELDAANNADPITGIYNSRTLQNVTIPVSAQHSHLAAHATGGIIPPHSWGLTGDQGPELVFGGSTGVSVATNSQTNAMLSGGDHQSITVEVYLDSMKLGGILGQSLVKSARLQGVRV